MMGFESYGLFLLKLVSVIAAILLLWFGIMLISTRAKRVLRKGYLSVTSMDKVFSKNRQLLEEVILNKKQKKQRAKILKKQDKQCKRVKEQKKVFVVDFKGDMSGSAVENLRHEIDVIVQVADPKYDEVLLRLESPGGVVPSYGLAASQLDRCRQVGIKLVVAVDKVAASGGYMMACVADQIIAAPFAIIGSIGVIFQLPNLYKWLDKKGIAFEQVKAGEFKRTLTVFGKNTEDDRHKVQEEVDQTHALFKQFIQDHRPKVDIAQVATGEYWCAKQAISMCLVDDLQTSDDYLLVKHQQINCAIYHVAWKTHKSLKHKFSQAAKAMLLGV